MTLTLSSQHPVDVLFVLDSYTEADTIGVFPARDLLSAPLAYVGKFLKIKYAVVPARQSPGVVTAKQIREDRDRFGAVVGLYKPKVIVPLGKNALYAVEWMLPDVLMPLPAFRKVEDRVFTSHIRGIRIVPTESLYGIESNYLLLRTLIENTQAALEGPNLLELPTDYRFLTTSAELKAYVQQPVHQGVIGLDTETTGLNFKTDQLRTVQFSFQSGHGATIPLDVVSPAQWQSLFAWLGKRGTFALQNGKFDYKFLREHLGVVLPDWHELGVAHQIVDEREGTHNLNFISQQLLGEGKFAVEIENFKGVLSDAEIQYAARDADLTRRSLLALEPATQTKAYQIMKRAGNALAHAEYRGMLVDQGKLDDLLVQVDTKLGEYEDTFSTAGFNPNSPVAVARHFSLENGADKAALAELDDPLAQAVTDFRALGKIRSTYLLRVRAATRADGLFHPDYRLTGASTGRLSSGSGQAAAGLEWQPINIMNIPRPALAGNQFTLTSEEIRAQLRGLWVARPGYTLVGADFEAAEMRWAANLSGDPQMIADMNNRFDSHSYFAIEAYNLPVVIDEAHPTEFSKAVNASYKALRQDAKSGVFATLYGAGARKIAATLGVEVAIAERLQRAMFTRWPGLEAWIKRIHTTIQQKGVLTSYFGRTRHFPYSTGAYTRKTLMDMLRQGQNGEVQGPASDYALLALGNFDKEYRERDWNIWAFVHDAIYLEVPDYDKEGASAALKYHMESALDLPATIFAEVHSGRSWIEL